MELPTDYLVQDWEGKRSFIKRERWARFREFLDEYGFKGVGLDEGYTSYFKLQVVLRGGDADRTTLGRTAYYQRREQVALTRIDGIFLNAPAREAMQQINYDYHLQIDSRWSGAQLWEAAKKAGLGSDHIPLTVLLECRKPDLFRQAVEGQVAVLVDNPKKRLFAYMIAQADRATQPLVNRWRQRAGLVTVARRMQRRWRRVVQRGVDMMVLRYWHIR